MQKLSEKIKIMLENGDDHILWMNFRFDMVFSPNKGYNSTRLLYQNDNQKFFCYIEILANNICEIVFNSSTKYSNICVVRQGTDVDKAWHDALKEFRTQTMNMIVAADHLVDVCNHFLKSDENFSELIIPERN